LHNLFTEFLRAMTHSLPYFYGNLSRVKTVESVNRGEAMKDFIKGALLIISVLALVLAARVALFLPLHHAAMSVTNPAPIAAAHRVCAAMAVEMPCFQPTDLRS
jgi:hypothetical protein